MKIRLNLFFIFYCFNLTTAQEYIVKTTPIFNQDGTSIYDAELLIDSNQFLWYTSDYGLTKQIGNEHIFYPYNHPIKKIISGPPILVDVGENTIIGFSLHGIFSLNAQSGIIDWLHLPKNKETTVFSNYKKDAKGNIWVGTKKGKLFRYSQNHELKIYDITQLFEDGEIDYRLKVMDVLEDESLLLQRNKKWYRYRKNKIYLVADKVPLNNIEREYNSQIIKNGLLFKKNTSGNFRFKDRSFSYVYIPEFDRQVFQWPYYRDIQQLLDVKVDEVSSSIFVSTLDSKLLIFTINVNNKLEVLKEFDFKNLIRSFQVSKNVIWVNNFDGNTSIIINQKLFKRTEINVDKKYKNEFMSFRGVERTSNGTIYTFSYLGWYKLNNGEKAFNLINFYHEKTQKLLTKSLHSFYKQNDTTFWAYGYQKKIFKINIKSKTYSEVSLPKDVISDSVKVFDIVALDSQNLLIAGNFGIYSFNTVTQQFKNYNNISDTISLKDKHVHDLYLDKNKNQLWIGLLGGGGLYKKDFDSGSVLHFNSESTKAPLINNNINILHPDGEDILWIGTEKGLQKLNTRTLETQYFTRKEGLKNENITSILKDNKNLWVGTYNGLAKINSNGVVNMFFEKDGIPNNEFNKKSYLKVSNDSLFFGGLNGMVSFNPQKINKSANRNTLTLTEVNYYNTKQQKPIKQINNLQKKQRFIIPYNNDLINLKFSLNDLYNPNEALYRYRLVGLHKNMISLGNHNEITLAGIKAGNYILEIEGVNSYGQPSNKLKYNFIVKQVLYKRTWFIIVIVLIVIGGVTIGVFTVIKDITQKKNLLQLEEKILRRQINPHFIFNILNGIQSKMILEGEEVANKFIIAFAGLIRQTLNINNSECIPLKEEIKYLTSYLSLELIRLDNNFKYTIEVSECINQERILIPALLLQPIVENAIRHGFKNKQRDNNLKVTFKLQNKFLLIEIIDNGIGREMAQQHSKKQKQQNKSIAINILKQRIALVNTKNKNKIAFKIIDLKNNNISAGTKVLMQIPVKLNCTSQLN